MRCAVCQNIAKETEKTLHLPETHRLKQRDAKSGAENLCKKLGEHQRVPFKFFTVKPWEKRLGKIGGLDCLSQYPVQALALARRTPYSGP